MKEENNMMRDLINAWMHKNCLAVPIGIRIVEECSEQRLTNDAGHHPHERLTPHYSAHDLHVDVLLADDAGSFDDHMTITTSRARLAHLKGLPPNLSHTLDGVACIPIDNDGNFLHEDNTIRFATYYACKENV